MLNEQFEKELDFHSNYEEIVDWASEYIKEELKDRKPKFALTLGSGLGEFAEKLNKAVEIPYDSIPNFPKTTVAGHEGKLIVGNLEGIEIICLKGRKHYYEVADKPFNNGILEVVLPIQVLANLGVENYFATNAAGGLNPKYGIGDLMIIKSHINLIPNPLAGRQKDFKNLEGKTIERFQPMNNAYDSKLRNILREASFTNFASIHVGTYLAVSGPSYETEAECVAFRDSLKADAVGMSTAPEVIVARNRGMKAVGLSCITNIIAQDGTNAANHKEVKAILESKEVKDRFSSTIERFFRIYAKEQ
jgi:purine-nucleoside phosphorylase